MSDDFQDAAPIARKTMVLFFLLDTSGSMSGEKIETVNEAIRETIPIIKEISNDNADAEIKFAVLSFSSGTSWITPSPVDLNSYKFQDLTAGGCTDMGEAFAEVASKLDKNAFLSSQVGNLAPVMILMSDGEPTGDYKRGLATLKQNKWYKPAIKIAFSIGQDANNDILAEFTENMELVIDTDNKQMLKKMIRFDSVTSSKVGSQTKGTAQSKQDQVAEAVKEEVQSSIADSETEVSGGW